MRIKLVFVDPRLTYRNILALLLSFVLVAPFAQQGLKAQSASNAEADKAAKLDSIALHQALLDLTNPWTVMCVAAHPDDEDGSTLTILRRKYGVHTVSLFSTYGEGGQNAVGPELYEDLGVIRARETMAAAEVQGSEPHFLGMRDFGFSKSSEETFRAWGEREALRRMVLQIRQLRPDVIITNHDTTSGHGHHQATGRLILQAFDAAADPKQFPEQLKEVSVWQAQRLFVRGFRGPQPAETQQPTITIDPNEMDPVRGQTYAQQALSALQRHATQGPWPKSLSPTGGRIIRYSLVRQVSTAAPLPADAKTPIDGLQLPEAIRNRFVAPTIDGKPLTEFLNNRTEVLISLMNARRRGAFTAPADVLSVDAQRFKLMEQRLDNALATTAGVSLAITPTDQFLVPGYKEPFEVTLSNAGDEEVRIRRLVSRGLAVDKQLDPADKLLPGTETSQQLLALTPKKTPISVPSAEHLYDDHLFGEVFTVEAEVEIEGAPFSLITRKQVDVAPAVEITSNNPSPCVETPATVLSCQNTSLTLTNHLGTAFKGILELSTTIARHFAAISREISLGAKESRKVFNGPLTTLRPKEKLTTRQQAVPIKAQLRDRSEKELISERVIPSVYIPAVAIAGLRVGYIPSTDPTLKHSLAALGVDAKELSADDVSKQDLSKFNSIIIDNRGYEIHPELIAANGQLLKFVENGGTLIVFYHKTNEWNPDERRNRPQLAPYPIILDDERVTEEDAPVTILQPGHPLLNSPNRITQRDFDGWVQERGLYYPRDWDSHYTALFATNDKGEKPLRGGLLVADYGKGHYIYTSMVWYRQLRAAVPGGYRFFANLISYGKH